MNPFDRIHLLHQFETWKHVPRLVTERMQAATKLAAALASNPMNAAVVWEPEANRLAVVCSDSFGVRDADRYCRECEAATGLKAAADVDFPETGIMLKGANEAWLNMPYRWAGAMTGGPSPLTNALVSGLLGGGMGYLGGSVLDALSPNEYVRPGHFRKMLGLLGAGGGAALSLIDAPINASLSREAGKPLGWRALITPNADVPIDPNNPAVLNNRLNALPPPDPMIDELDQLYHGPRPSPEFPKAPGTPKAGMDTGLSSVRPTPVDAFNQAIWNDVAKGVESSRYNPWGTKDVWGDNSQSLHTPPAVGAAVSGVVSGIAGGAPLLSPSHFISGLAAAGVDSATAKVTGSVLGVLGGLTPRGQEQLQNMGLWGGLMRGVATSLFSGQ